MQAKKSEVRDELVNVRGQRVPQVDPATKPLKLRNRVKELEKMHASSGLEQLRERRIRRRD